jgi:hypothetical protein
MANEPELQPDSHDMEFPYNTIRAQLPPVGRNAAENPAEASSPLGASMESTANLKEQLPCDANRIVEIDWQFWVAKKVRGICSGTIITLHN